MLIIPIVKRAEKMILKNKKNFNKKNLMVLLVLAVFISQVLIVQAGTGRTIQGNIIQDNNDPAEEVIVIVHTQLDNGCECSTPESSVSYTDTNGEYAEASNNLNFDIDCLASGASEGDNCDGYWNEDNELWITVDGSPVGLLDESSPSGGQYSWGFYYLAGDFADVISVKLPPLPEEEVEEPTEGSLENVTGGSSRDWNSNSGSSSCQDECEEQELECLGKVLYKECFYKNGCWTWDIKIIDDNFKCFSNQLIPIDSEVDIIQEVDSPVTYADNNQINETIPQVEEVQDNLTGMDTEIEWRTINTFIIGLVLLLVLLLIIYFFKKNKKDDEKEEKLNTKVE